MKEILFHLSDRNNKTFCLQPVVSFRDCSNVVTILDPRGRSYSIYIFVTDIYKFSSYSSLSSTVYYDDHLFFSLRYLPSSEMKHVPNSVSLDQESFSWKVYRFYSSLQNRRPVYIRYQWEGCIRNLWICLWCLCHIVWGTQCSLYQR